MRTVLRIWRWLLEIFRQEWFVCCALPVTVAAYLILFPTNMTIEQWGGVGDLVSGICAVAAVIIALNWKRQAFIQHSIGDVRGYHELLINLASCLTAFERRKPTHFDLERLNTYCGDAVDYLAKLALVRNGLAPTDELRLIVLCNEVNRIGLEVVRDEKEDSSLLIAKATEAANLADKVEKSIREMLP